VDTQNGIHSRPTTLKKVKSAILHECRGRGAYLSFLGLEPAGVFNTLFVSCYMCLSVKSSRHMLIHSMLRVILSITVEFYTVISAAK